MNYRVGMPGWRTLARLGARVYFRADVHFDPEVKRYFATSPDLDGLTVEAGDLDELQQEILLAAAVLVDLKMGNRDHADVRARLRRDVALPCAA